MDLYTLATEKAKALVEAQAASAEYRCVIRLSRSQHIIDRYARACSRACDTAARLEDRYRAAVAA
jgi:hypothetical protein